VTWQRNCLFGEIIDGIMRANDAGLLAQNEWKRLSIRFPGMYTDDFVVMPDHIHGIIALESVIEKSRRLGTIIGAYKSTVTRLINGLHHTPGAPVWQRNYFEHIISNEKDFNKIQTYIEENPSKWGENLIHLNYPSNIP
jgi:REP element-mobilizing transposase RayT